MAVNSSDLDCQDQVRSRCSFGVDVRDILTLSHHVVVCAHNEQRILGMGRQYTHHE